jgi:preprotein translocase subunit Sec63
MNLALAILLFFFVFVHAEDYYKILGLSRSASKSEIKKRYRELSVRVWPKDKLRNNIILIRIRTTQRRLRKCL